MLKITLHDTPEQLQFQLEGRLIGAWVTEFEQCWSTAASIRGGRKVVVDLRDVTFIDEPGKDLLRRLTAQDVDLVARDALTKAIVEEVRRAGRQAVILAALSITTTLAIVSPVRGLHPDARACIQTGTGIRE
jgi:anti-anti-sigma regulatory factor